MIDLLKWGRNVLLILMTGAAVGAYEAHQIEVVPLIKLAIGGACAQPGIQTVSVSLISWYNCQDTVVANHIQTSDAEREAEMTAALLESENYKAPKKKGKR